MAISSLFDQVGRETNAPRSSCAERQTAHHRKVLAMVCGVFLLAFLLNELPDGRVAVRGLPQFPFRKPAPREPGWG